MSSYQSNTYILSLSPPVSLFIPSDHPFSSLTSETQQQRSQQKQSPDKITCCGTPFYSRSSCFLQLHLSKDPQMILLERYIWKQLLIAGWVCFCTRTCMGLITWQLWFIGHTFSSCQSHTELFFCVGFTMVLEICLQAYIVYMGDVPEAGISAEDDHHSLLLNAIGEYEKMLYSLSWKIFGYLDLIAYLCATGGLSVHI